MNYLPINRHPHRRSRVWFAILLFAVFLITILNLLGFNFLPSILYKTGQPLWRITSFWDDTIGHSIAYLKSKDVLDRDNDNLKRELTLARQQIFLSEEKDRQNAEMKSLLGRMDHQKIIFATVLSSPPVSPYDVLILDVGVRNGIVAGDRIISAGGSALGEITEVYGDYSKANLYSAPGTELSVFIGESGVAVTATGVGGGAFEVVLPKEQDVSIGQPVYLSSIEPLLIGVVDRVFTRDVDFLKLVMISALENIYEIRYVGVVASTSLMTAQDE